MEIPVVYANGDENEFDIELCCPECAKSYGWTEAQYNKVLDVATNGSLTVPDTINTVDALKVFIKSL